MPGKHDENREIKSPRKNVAANRRQHPPQNKVARKRYEK
jgi:hypothetical protein